MVAWLDPRRFASLFVGSTSDIPGSTSDKLSASLSEAVLVDPILGSRLGRLSSSYMQ